MYTYVLPTHPLILTKAPPSHPATPLHSSASQQQQNQPKCKWMIFITITLCLPWTVTAFLCSIVMLKIDHNTATVVSLCLSTWVSCAVCRIAERFVFYTHSPVRHCRLHYTWSWGTIYTHNHHTGNSVCVPSTPGITCGPESKSCGVVNVSSSATREATKIHCSWEESERALRDSI